MKKFLSKINLLTAVLLSILYFNCTSSNAIDTYIKYKIQNGDTFYKISETYQMNIEEIKKANSNTNYLNLTVGDEINLPTKIYRIDSNITLEEIATKFNTSVETIMQTNRLLKKQLCKGDFIKIASGYDVSKKVSKVEEKINDKTLDEIKDNPFKTFMFKNKSDYEGLYDSYNAVRTWSPNGETVRGHEGIDIMSEYGTPIYAVASGTIARFGWNTYGGWRINIKLDDYEYYTYYAHMSKYASGMYLGKHVECGELIGYVGDTGYGSEGTSGKFEPHLHFGLYDKDMKSLSPFNYLVDIEKKFFE